jgi:type 1 fimbria pilin
MSLPQNTNVTLDTNTNSGSIQSNFAFPIQKSGDMASYNGPLTPGNANAQATLVVDVSLGNITYQKQNM